MSSKASLTRFVTKNHSVAYSYTEGDSILLFLKDKFFVNGAEFSLDVKTSLDEIERNYETFARLEKIFRVSLNQSDFQARGLRYLSQRDIQGFISH